MSKPKVCPCCGDTMLMVRKIANGVWQGWCFACGALGPVFETSTEAFEAWGEETPDEVPNHN